MTRMLMAVLRSASARRSGARLPVVYSWPASALGGTMAEQPEREMASFFAERGFGQRLGFGERPALAVIDFMNAFTDPAMPLGSNLDREIAATREVLAAAR